MTVGSLWPAGDARYLTEDRRVRAVLETSFWTIAHRAEVAANCFDFFDMIVPGAVEEEILRRPADYPRREYPYATLFRHLRSRMVDPPEPEPRPLSVFGRGEAAAIALAQAMPDDQRAVLLINERRGEAYARRAGLVVANVPDFILMLHRLAVISDRAARRKLDLIASHTAPALIDHAHAILDEISSERDA